MKKIIVLQIPNAKNNGSAMMAINSINYFDTHFKGDVEFCCDFSTEEDKKLIVSELNSNTNVSTLDLPKFERGSSIASSFLNRQRWVKETIRVIEAEKPLSVLVLGGDDFSEYYSGYKIIVRLYFMYRLSLHFPVYLIGHTIGPFSSWRKSAFRFLMARCKIVTRDANSLEHCQKDLKHKHSTQGHDLAWFNLPRQTQELKDKMLAKYCLQENQYVTVTPSALVKHYAETDADYLASWKKLLETLVSDDRHVVLMPHVFNNVKRDDRWVISEIKKQLPNLSGVTYIEDMLLPSECRAIVSGCHFSIACRMHAAVSTLQTGKPSIALSYSAKYAGVIGGDMNLPELVIEAADKGLWKTGLVERIEDKVKFVEDNYASLTQRIVDRVKVIQEEQDEIMNEYGNQMLKNEGSVFVK
ncbi:polysaccharide pyruvyl transferase family protein [Photobacterium profundum]|uniref:polysaccharide pyruvyl transferase family protein n=1 Tax=Photobacterium profundum TaxID=74109 RepID=UPI003D0A767E